MMNGYTCSTCGEFHGGLPFSYGAYAPALWFEIPEDEREARTLLSSDQCVIDEVHFFIQGRLEIPVLDAEEDLFSWNVWVSLSKQSFDRTAKFWERDGRESERPCFGWLSTDLPCYSETTLNLKTSVHTRPVGERPFIELAPGDHQLAIEQIGGITK